MVRTTTMHFGILAIPAAFLIFYLVVNEIVRAQRRIKGIPGPSGVPVVGNLHQVWHDSRC